MQMFILNLLIAIGLVSLGAYGTAWIIAVYIVDHSEVEILAKIRELKKEAEEAANDNRNA